MDFGTAIHETVELFKCKNPDPVYTPEMCIFLFKEKFKYLYEKNKELYNEREKEFLAKKDVGPEFFLNAGERIIKRFDENEELRNAEVVYNEYKLFDQIDRTDDVDIKFKGFIDMVIKTKAKNGDTVLYVCDFKTCSWGWGYEKRNDQNLHFQILLYKHFLCKKFGLDPKYVRTAFVLLKKKPKPITKGSKETESPIEFFALSAGPVAVQRALNELNRDITELSQREKAGTLVKNRSNCINKFGDRCPYYETELCPKD